MTSDSNQQLAAEMWQTWDQRLADFVDSGMTEFSPTEKDLVLKRAGWAPASMIKNSLDEMTIGDWSRVATSALAGTSPGEPTHCPSWLIVPALVALGLGEWSPNVLRSCEQHKGLSTKDSSGEEDQFVEHWLARAEQYSKGSGASVVIVVPKGIESVTNHWNPFPRYGAIAVSGPAEVEALARMLPVRLDGGRDPILLFIEAGPLSIQVQLQVLVLKAEWPDYNAVFDLLTGHGKRGYSSAAIERPRSLDDAMERALSRYQHGRSRPQNATRAAWRSLSGAVASFLLVFARSMPFPVFPD